MADSISKRIKKPEIIINELGQKVRVYDWEDLCHRISLRKFLARDTDLSGKTLVIKHTWGAGDVLYSTPAIHRLKQKFPTCTLIYVCIYPELLEGNPDVDKVIHYMDDNAYSEFVDDIDEEWYWLDYDTPLKGGFDYKVNLRSKPQLNEFMVKLIRKNPDELSGDERDFVNQASNSVISRYQMVALDMYCAHAYCEDAEKTVFYYPKDYELEMAKKFLEPLRKNGKKVITLMPHSSSVYKDYPHWREVLRRCPTNYYWLVVDGRKKEGEEWLGPNMYNMSGAFQIRQSAAIVIEADLHCSSDTGLLYPRAARGGKVVVTYGPHEPQPFLHYFPSATGMRIEHLKTTPGMEGMCSVGCYIDTESCHIKGQPPPCLMELHPQVVADKIVELLGK